MEMGWGNAIRTVVALGLLSEPGDVDEALAISLRRHGRPDRIDLRFLSVFSRLRVCFTTKADEKEGKTERQLLNLSAGRPTGAARFGKPRIGSLVSVGSAALMSQFNSTAREEI
ncbi:hypothetical protein GW17_00019569 [Ensete ventricosum]|nr:hypothetical protein GW17_00019569 [Ensete ventricosum]